jgi:hypothetical protein
VSTGPLLPPLPAGLLLLGGLVLLLLSRAQAIRRRWPALTGDLAAALLLGALCAGFHWRVLFTREASVPAGGGDFNSFYFPLARFAAGQLQAGRLPLWNPTLHAGAPFAADPQTGLLYPPNLLAFLLARPFEYGALEALAILHFWLASVTAYALWRGLGGGRPAAVVAGVTYAYGGFLVAHLGHPPMLAVAAWLPLLLLCLRPALAELRRDWLVAAGVVLALMVLAGHPQLLLMSLVVAAGWGAVAAWQARPAEATAADGRPGRWALRYWGSRAAAGAAVLALGGALAAPVLLPAVQLGLRSVRASLAYGESTAFSLRPLHLVHLLVPKAFGDSPTSYLNALGFSGEVWAYAGAVTLLLAALAAALRPRWPVMLGLALAALALLLMLGPATPLHGWFYRFVPGFGQMRAPGRWSLVYSLGLALAAAGGVDALVCGLREGAQAVGVVLRRAVRVLALGSAGLAALLIALTGSLLGPRDPSAPLANFLDGLGWLLLLALLALALLAALAAGRLRPAAAGWLLAGLVVLDLFSAHIAFNPTAADLLAGFRHPEIVAALRAAGNARLDSDTGAPELWQPSTAAVYDLRDVAGAYNPLGLADYAAVYAIAHRDRAAPVYDLLGVTHLVARSDRLPRAGQTTLVLTTPARLTLLARQGGLPRAAVIHAARTFDDPDAVLVALRTPGFDPAREVLLLDSTASAPPGSAGAPPARPATIIRDEPDLLEIAATADAGGYLLIADSYYPGWRAEVDGQPAAVERANYAFRAVRLTPGAHTVRLIFDPPLWRIGWALAAAAAVAGALLLATARRAAPGSVPRNRGGAAITQRARRE